MVSVKNFEPNFHNLFRFELDSAMDEHSKKHVRTTLQKLHADLDKCIRFSDFQGKKGKFILLGLRRQTKEIGYL